MLRRSAHRAARRIKEAYGLDLWKECGMSQATERARTCVEQARSLSSTVGRIYTGHMSMYGADCRSAKISAVTGARSPAAVTGARMISSGTRYLLADVTIEVPPMAESITEGTVAGILKGPGDSVFEDDVIAQLETDKVTIDVKYQRGTPGVIKSINFGEGDTVEVGQAFAVVEETPDAQPEGKSQGGDGAKASSIKKDEVPAPPKKEPVAKASPPSKTSPAPETKKPSAGSTAPDSRLSRPERRVKMTRLRKRIAERLKGAQNTYAMLTTFNEVDMTNLMSMRSEYKDSFLERHGVKLGFMSAFVKASANALQLVPAVNGVIEDEDIIYRDFYDVSVAVSTPKGLVVPVLRDVDAMSFADVEKKINELGRKARDGTLAIDEMAGGTFTISNGGVFGSLMGTPIINPPQSAILGMHATKMRPAVVDGSVVARPMMYLALTYDHRLIDGREAVTFLKRIKEIIEDPRRLLLDV
eukprot:jgi/Picsp_1/1529/NSC_05007-R1_dihydrolipoyllysine-residue succinyltransferase component of 2-oxoglutarate dehydrogenase complex